MRIDSENLSAGLVIYFLTITNLCDSTSRFSKMICRKYIPSAKSAVEIPTFPLFVTACSLPVILVKIIMVSNNSKVGQSVFFTSKFTVHVGYSG